MPIFMEQFGYLLYYVGVSKTKPQCLVPITPHVRIRIDSWQDPMQILETPISSLVIDG